MPYVQSIHVNEFRHIQGLDIDVTPTEGHDFSHLILTGPNGAGKSFLLLALQQSIDFARNGLPQPVAYKVKYGPGDNFVRNGQPTTAIYSHFNAFRQASFGQPAGPNNVQIESAKFGTAPNVGNQLLQVFVNQKTQQAFALTEGNHEAAAEIDAWFEEMRIILAAIFADQELQIKFQRKPFRFEVALSDGRVVNFHELADGQKAALAITAELFLRKDVIRSESGILEPSGIVLIDEIETHLHLQLQESILPFLVRVFPRIQFIVATHSPAVICSVDNAVIFDLQSRARYYSDEIRGVKYGTLMTSHFGISSDFDLDSTAKLRRLIELKNRVRDADEEVAFRELAAELSEQSHALALEVMLQLRTESVSE